MTAARTWGSLSWAVASKGYQGFSRPAIAYKPEGHGRQTANFLIGVLQSSNQGQGGFFIPDFSQGNGRGAPHFGLFIL